MVTTEDIDRAIAAKREALGAVDKDLYDFPFDHARQKALQPVREQLVATIEDLHQRRARTLAGLEPELLDQKIPGFEVTMGDLVKGLARGAKPVIRALADQAETKNKARMLRLEQLANLQAMAIERLVRERTNAA